MPNNQLFKELEKELHQGNFDNKDLVQLIELAGNYLNLQTISDYAKEKNISYNGAKNFRNVVKLFNVKFIIDND